MWDIGVGISWPDKSQSAYRTSRPIRFGWSRCDIWFCFLAIKSQSAYRTSRPIRFGWSMCDIWVCISWPEKHKVHIAHLGRLGSVGRDAILGFVFLGHTNRKVHIAHLDRFGSVGRAQPSATSPLFMTISISNISTNISRWICSWHFCRNVRNGDCHKKGTSPAVGNSPPFLTNRPCGKQHFREIATPDWVGTLRRFTHTRQYVLFVKWPTKSGVAISRKCCFPHGKPAFSRFSQNCEPLIVVEIFGKIVKRQVWCQKRRWVADGWTSCRRLVEMRYWVLYFLARKSQDAYRTSRPIRFGWSMSAVGN